jgi:hypothetical protein
MDHLFSAVCVCYSIYLQLTSIARGRACIRNPMIRHALVTRDPPITAQFIPDNFFSPTFGFRRFWRHNFNILQDIFLSQLFICARSISRSPLISMLFSFSPFLCIYKSCILWPTFDSFRGDIPKINFSLVLKKTMSFYILTLFFLLVNIIYSCWSQFSFANHKLSLTFPLSLLVSLPSYTPFR